MKKLNSMQKLVTEKKFHLIHHMMFMLELKDVQKMNANNC